MGDGVRVRLAVETTVTTTMERRKFVIGAGALATGSAAALGTGAFTSVEAERSISLEVEGDEAAYLQLSPSDSHNGNEYAEVTSDGLLELSFTDNDNDGEGLNAQANSRLNEIFEIRNEGTQTVSVWISKPGDAGGPNSTAAASTEFLADDDGNEVDISFPSEIDLTDKNANPAVGDNEDLAEGGYVEIDTGESVTVDMRFLVSGTTHVDSDVLEGDFVINAEAGAEPSSENDYEF